MSTPPARGMDPCKSCIKLLKNMACAVAANKKHDMSILSFADDCTCTKKLLEELKVNIEQVRKRNFIKHIAPKFNGPDRVVYRKNINDFAGAMVILERTFKGSEKISFKRRINDPVSDVYDNISEGVIDAENTNPLIPYYRPKKDEKMYFTLARDKIHEFCKNKEIREVIFPDTPRCMYFEISFAKVNEITRYKNRREIIDLLCHEILILTVKFGFIKGNGDCYATCINEESGYYFLAFKNIGFANVNAQMDFLQFMEKSCTKYMLDVLIDIVIVPDKNINVAPIFFTADAKKIEMMSSCFIDGCVLYTGAK